MDGSTDPIKTTIEWDTYYKVMKERYYNGINEMNNVATDVITRLCKSLDIEPAPYLKELKDLREGKA